jgi:hypothetical protein
MMGPTYHVVGVPFRTGSLYPGSENDAQAYRTSKDPRIRIVEVSEYASLRDLDQRHVDALVALLVEGFRR